MGLQGVMRGGWWRAGREIVADTEPAFSKNGTEKHKCRREDNPAPKSRAEIDSALLLFPLSSSQSKEEVMAVRLREADSMAAMAELRQKIAELEIQVRMFGFQNSRKRFSCFSGTPMGRMLCVLETKRTTPS